MARIKREELLEKLFRDDYEHLKGKRLRLTRVRVPGKEVCLAHVISPSEACIYENLGLHIGVHEGEDHRGEAVGMIRFTPWEAVVVAADVAIKAADVQIGFMDRFCGTLTLPEGSARFRLQWRKLSGSLIRCLDLKPVKSIKAEKQDKA